MFEQARASPTLNFLYRIMELSRKETGVSHSLDLASLDVSGTSSD